MNILLVLFAIVLGCRAWSDYDLVHEQWKAFKAEHGKQYQSESEERIRLKVFMENSVKIARHNKLFNEGLSTFTMGINKFADLTHHEFISIMNGFNKTKNISKRNKDPATFIPPANVILPASVDWREKGAVTPVKDQGNCGSCWSFSATGSLEGQNFRKTGELVSLSEQNLMDCSTSYGNQGCNGGWVEEAFRYIEDNDGIDTEDSYPYREVDGWCQYSPESKGATDRGFISIESGDEDGLKAAVATVGPVSIAIDASRKSFQFYTGGIYHEPDCSSDDLDHAVLAVGYGTDDEGTGDDYWLVKNSWGTSWGLEGYIKMPRNKDNHCGVATEASYPLV